MKGRELAGASDLWPDARDAAENASDRLLVRLQRGQRRRVLGKGRGPSQAPHCWVSVNGLRALTAARLSADRMFLICNGYVTAEILGVDSGHQLIP
jgi:hypothetical protein